MPHNQRQGLDPVNDAMPTDPSPDLVFRRGKLRKRDDPAVDMLREAMADGTEVARIRRIVLELGRLYNPVTNGPILDVPTGRRVVECLESSRVEEARRLLGACLSLYIGREAESDDPLDTPGPTRLP